MKFSITLFFLILFLSLNVYARRPVQFFIHEPYNSVRTLGMGGAFSALADDYSALFYNPAGLGRRESSQLNIGLGLTMDRRFFKLYDEIKDLTNSDDSNGTDSDDIEEVIEFLERRFGEHYHLRFPALSAFYVRPNFGIALAPLDLALDLTPRQIGGASMDLIAHNDSILAIGWGMDTGLFKMDRLTLGLTGKMIYRVQFATSLLASDIVFNDDLEPKEWASEGLGFDADIGFLYTPYSWTGWVAENLRPTFSLVVRNVADGEFTKNYGWIDEEERNPDSLERRIDSGLLFELPDWWIWQSRFVMDVRNIGHSNFSLLKGFHAGLEFAWHIRQWWQGAFRAGVHQGYWTAGITGRLFIFNLDLATYGEEVGTGKSRKQSRRYALRTSFEW